MTEALETSAVSRWRSRLALLLAYLLVAAAAFHGFYSKAGFQDASTISSAWQMLDGSADRPYVFRQLDPMIANAVADAVPEAMQQRISSHFGDGRLVPEVATQQGPRGFIAYTVLYYLVFVEFLASLFVLRRLFAHFVDPVTATVAPAVWALLMPLIQAVNAGLFYDYPELLFLACAVLAAVEGRIPLLAIAVVLGTLNKESFLIFIPTLIPFLRPQMRPLKLAFVTVGLMALSGAIYAGISHAYAGNHGANIEVQWRANLMFYANPRTLLSFEPAYGLLLPRIYSLFWIAVGIFLLDPAWRRADKRVKQHLAIAFILNLPLFILFGAPAEIRNMSLCFVGLSCLIAYAVEQWLPPTSLRSKVDGGHHHQA